MDIPLFFEKNNYEFSQVLLIYAPESALLSRAAARDKCDESHVKSRLLAQMDIEKKRELADFIIDNSGDLSSLNAQISSFLANLKDKNARLKI